MRRQFGYRNLDTDRRIRVRRQTIGCTIRRSEAEISRCAHREKDEGGRESGWLSRDIRFLVASNRDTIPKKE